jgi:hypothetical protein
LFFQLLGTSFSNSIVIAAGLFLFNALYFAALFLVRWEWVRALVGTVLALIVEVTLIRHWDFKWLRETFPNFAAFSVLTAWSFGLVVLVCCIILLIWKRRRGTVDLAEKVHEILPLGIHERLMDYLIIGKAKFETFMYLALTEQYWMVGGFVLEALAMKALSVMLWPFLLLKWLVMKALGRPRRWRKA